MPAVEYQGKALYESLVLCEFLEDAYPKNTPHLLPTDAYTRAFIRLWIDFVSKSIIPTYFRLLQAQDKEKQDAALADFISALRTISEKRQKGGPYFLGNEFSLADIAIAPFAVRDYIVKEHRGYRREDVSNDWVEWAKALESRESVKKTSSVSTSSYV